MYENKKIYVLGMARSGYEVSKLLSNKNNKIVVTDMKLKDMEHVNELRNLGVEVIETDDQESLLDESFDLLIKNPGIKLDNPTVLKAESLNIPVINEVEVAYEYLKDNYIIAISGSNGKTTTTSLTYEILNEAMDNVLLGGNIGYPVCSLVEKSNGKNILVLEISSHQLTNMYNFKANIAVLTNLTSVHLDHFGTFENYMSYKKKIFNNQDSKDISILNAGDKNVMDCYDKLNTKKITFSSNKEADLYLKDNAIYYKNEKIIDTKDIILKGNHNYENIMCAIAIAKELNVSNDIIKNVLGRFKGVSHRLEFVKKINGVDYYNDSKATNTDSTIVALKSFDTPIILLLGGLDRGHSFEPLTPYMNNVKLIVSYGETKDRIKEYGNSINKEVIVCNTLTEAFNKANEHAINGDTILLSPACASWDQYDKFETRGEEFIKLVNEIDE